MTHNMKMCFTCKQNIVMLLLLLFEIKLFTHPEVLNLAPTLSRLISGGLEFLGREGENVSMLSNVVQRIAHTGNRQAHQVQCGNGPKKIPVWQSLDCTFSV